MQKFVFNTILISMLLLFSSCGSMGENRTNMLNKQSEDEMSINYLEQIIELINIKDKSKIASLFSEQAQIDAKDLDESIDYLFAIIEGDIKTWDKIGGNVSESVQGGIVLVEFTYRFKIYTDKEQYIFSVRGYSKDTNNPKNIGLYSLKVFNVKCEPPLFRGAGIYIEIN